MKYFRALAHPVYSDAARYPELARLRAYVSAGGWAILSLTIAVSALRYWASGLTASGSYEAIQGMVRGAAAAGAMVVYPRVFEWLCVAGNLLTHALLDAPGVEGGLTKLLAAAVLTATLAIGGCQSPPWLSAATRAVADTIPGARYLTLDGQDHGVLNQPDALRPVLLDFLT